MCSSTVMSMCMRTKTQVNDMLGMTWAVVMSAECGNLFLTAVPITLAARQ